MKKQRKITKDIFVIMPFVSSPNRNQQQLDSYFNNIIKSSIENATVLDNNYHVFRSNDEFNITDSIIQNLASADIVIADLSGEHANPNVMYELGVRLSLSEKPVILLREKHDKNRDIFDVKWYYTFYYDTQDYEPLKIFLLTKIRKFEIGEEIYKSPILNLIEKNHLTKFSQKSRLIGILRNLRVMAFSQVAFFTERLGRYINQFVEFRLEYTSDIVKLFSTDLRNQVEVLDYEKFYWSFEDLRIIDYLLANPQLFQEFPFSISPLITRYLMAYQNSFNQHYHEYDKWFFYLIEEFISETYYFLSFIDRVLDLLEAGDIEKEAALIKIVFEGYSHSPMMAKYDLHYGKL